MESEIYMMLDFVSEWIEISYLKNMSQVKCYRIAEAEIMNACKIDPFYNIESGLILFVAL